VSIVVVAAVTAVDGALAELAALFLEAAIDVHDEPGCELYAVHETDEQVVVIEKWVDAASLQAHREGKVVAALLERARPLACGPADIKIVRPSSEGMGRKSAL